MKLRHVSHLIMIEPNCRSITKQCKLYFAIDPSCKYYLYPTMNRIAANTERGIIFSKRGIRMTEISNKNP